MLSSEVQSSDSPSENSSPGSQRTSRSGSGTTRLTSNILRLSLTEQWKSVRESTRRSSTLFMEHYREKLTIDQLFLLWVLGANSIVCLAVVLLRESCLYLLRLPLVVRLRTSAQLEREQQRKAVESSTSHSKSMQLG